MRSARHFPAAVAAVLVACGGSSPSLGQPSTGCPAGRTALDGVCVAEAIADYVACVRSQGAQLGGERGQRVSADVGTLGLRAAGAAEVRESLEKKYSVSDAATLEIIKTCADTVRGREPAGLATRGYELFHDGKRVGVEPTWTRAQALENCQWNARQYPQIKVECAFEGRRMVP